MEELVEQQLLVGRCYHIPIEIFVRRELDVEPSFPMEGLVVGQPLVGQCYHIPIEIKS